MSACEGYACPPEHSTPASEVIRAAREGVVQVTQLADTGSDPSGVIAGAVVAVALVILGVILVRST